jgi:hypothetical protein
MNDRATLVCLGLIMGGPAVAGAGEPAGRLPPQAVDRAPAAAAPAELQLSNFFLARGTVTNQLARSGGRGGVSLGPIASGAGSGVRTGPDTTTYYVEQRWIPALTYAPAFIDRLAAFRASFEVDFSWGFAANQMQPNQGGGLNADQVNLQTKNVHVALFPTRDPDELAIVVGTQQIHDSVYYPGTTPLPRLARSGYKLAFAGTDGTGLSIYGGIGGRWKLSFTPLTVGQSREDSDPGARLAYAYFATADYLWPLRAGSGVGASLWLLRDDTRGSAFAYEGVVHAGPGSPELSPFTGVARLPLQGARGTVGYAGLNFHYNLDFAAGPWAASGFAMLNAGRFRSTAPGDGMMPRVDILGLASNLSVTWRYGRHPADRVELTGLLVSGDTDPADERYGSVITLNHYGLPGALWFDHGTLILFPFVQTISNYTGAVTDLSNRGHGLATAIAAASYELVPRRLSVKLGGAYAQAMAAPRGEAGAMQGGRHIGTELNAELSGRLSASMQSGLHAGVLFAGDLYDGNPDMATDPFAVFTTFSWFIP